MQGGGQGLQPQSLQAAAQAAGLPGLPASPPPNAGPTYPQPGGGSITPFTPNQSIGQILQGMQGQYGAPPNAGPTITPFNASAQDMQNALQSQAQQLQAPPPQASSFFGIPFPQSQPAAPPSAPPAMPVRPGPVAPPAATTPAAPPAAAADPATIANSMRRRPGGMATGGAVEEEGGKKKKRQFGAKEEAAEDIPAFEKKAKGGAIKHRRPPKLKAPVPMTPGGDEVDIPPPAAAAAAGPPPPGPPPPGLKKGGKLKKKKAKTIRKAKGGKCEKMAAGGAMKVRRGFPNVNAAPKKKFAEGGKVRGCGAATKGTKFSGIY